MPNLGHVWVKFGKRIEQHFREHVEMVKAIKGTNLELFDMNECDDLDATVDGGDVLYTGFWLNITTSHK